MPHLQAGRNQPRAHLPRRLSKNRKKARRSGWKWKEGQAARLHKRQGQGVGTVCGARTQWTQKCVGPLATKLKGSKSRGEGHTAHTQPQTKCSRDTRHYTYYDSCTWNDGRVTRRSFLSGSRRFPFSCLSSLRRRASVEPALPAKKWPYCTVSVHTITPQCSILVPGPESREGYMHVATCSHTSLSHCISVRIAHCPDRICQVPYPQGSSLDPPSRRTTSSRS